MWFFNRKRARLKKKIGCKYHYHLTNWWEFVHPCVLVKKMVSMQCGVKHVACCSCHGRPGSPPTDTRLRLQRRGAMPAWTGLRCTAHGPRESDRACSALLVLDRGQDVAQDVLSVNDGQWYAQLSLNVVTLMGWETRKMHLLHLLYRGKKVFSSLTRQQMWLTYDNGGT